MCAAELPVQKNRFIVVDISRVNGAVLQIIFFMEMMTDSFNYI